MSDEKRREELHMLTEEEEKDLENVSGGLITEERWDFPNNKSVHYNVRSDYDGSVILSTKSLEGAIDAAKAVGVSTEIKKVIHSPENPNY